MRSGTKNVGWGMWPYSTANGDETIREYPRKTRSNDSSLFLKGNSTVMYKNRVLWSGTFGRFLSFFLRLLQFVRDSSLFVLRQMTFGLFDALLHVQFDGFVDRFTKFRV